MNPIIQDIIKRNNEIIAKLDSISRESRKLSGK